MQPTFRTVPPDFLAKCQEIEKDIRTVQDTLNERGKTHGDFEKQAHTSQVLKNIISDTLVRNNKPLPDYQREALTMIAHKISRILNGNPAEPDHWRDIAGYATLVENILVHGKGHIG